MELTIIASALLKPVLTYLDIGMEDLDEKSQKAVEDCARAIGGHSSVVKLFYNAAKKAT